ncbi:hypothetical protein Acsp02_24860 [Actinoplanes sp. NBRC 103695]|nr:hypothetical protein Acsp02_24860 [Actinoplanes sp. NBRC 103695]
MVSILALCGFGGVAVSSMIVSAKEPQQAPQGMVDALCAQPGSDAEFDDLCPSIEPAGPVAQTDGGAPVDLPRETLSTDTELAAAYLDRYQRLLTSEKPGIRVGEIHLGGRASQGIIALNDKVHECDALTDVEIRPGKTSMIESNETHSLLAVRVVEVAPACVTGTKAAPGALVQGTTDLELDFVPVGRADGRSVWLLTEMHARPVRPDPLRSASPGKQGDAVVRTDARTLFSPAAS